MNILKSIENPEQLLLFMKNIEYKWMDKKGVIHSNLSPIMYNNFSLMTPEEVIKNMCGICVDQCCLERLWFEQNNYNFRILNIQLIRENESPGHVFAIYEKDNKYYWFENAWYSERGIHKYNNFEELIDDIKEKFIIQNNIVKSELNNLIIKDWPKYPFHISYEEMDIIEEKKKSI